MIAILLYLVLAVYIMVVLPVRLLVFIIGSVCRTIRWTLR